MRLDKMLTDCKAGSRSEVKELIRKGKVRVGGVTVKDAGMHVADTDIVTVEGRSGVFSIAGANKKSYFMLNKPAGTVSANSDAEDDTVIELFGAENNRELFTVGRLDKDTEGLLLVTDDGELSHFLLSPRRNVPKTYYAQADGVLIPEHVKLFEEGFDFKEYRSKPAKLEILSADEATSKSECLVTVTEGRFHEVKKLIAKVGCEVTYLKRVAFAGLKLDESLKTGCYRPLTEDEISLLRSACGQVKEEK